MTPTALQPPAASLRRQPVPRCARLGPACVLLALVLALAGCSSVRIGYNQADWIAAWMLGDYLDLEPAQRDLFLQRFRQFHAWHRREQLPVYAALLREKRARLEDGLSREDAQWLVARGRERIEAMIRHGADDLAELLVTLTPDQVRELERGFARSNQRLARDFAAGRPAAEQQRARAKRLVSQIEGWTGRLQPEQVERLTTLANGLPLTADARLADRQRRQREFLDLLRAGRTKPEVAAWLRDWLPNWERGRDPGYARLAREAFEQRIELFVEADRLLTPAQRQQVLGRLQGYIDDVVALAPRGGARAAAGSLPLAN